MKVLIVDDSKMVRMALSTKLNNLGFEVVEAESGADALGMIIYEKPDVIFLDIMMPVMDGIELCRHVREVREFKEVPIIMLTSKRESDTVLKALKAGATDYMVKPFSFEEITKKLSKHLGIDLSSNPQN